MIQYSTNMMGPVSLDWYRERGLTAMVSWTLESDIFAEMFGKRPGDQHEQEEVTEYWAGGRIDIYGVPGEHHPIEYSLPIMDGESWNIFSDWLDEYETEEFASFGQIISTFETETGHKIRWADEEFNNE